MSVLLQFLTEQGLMLLAGGTVLLAVGALCTAIQDSPVKQQRATELALLATLCWLALACVPMPRLSSAFFPLTQPTPAETPNADNQWPLNTQPTVLTKPRPDRADDRPKLQFESPVAGTGAAELLDGPSEPASSRPASDFVLNVEPPDAESVAGIDSTRSPQLSQPPLAGSSPARLAMDPSPDIKPGYDPAAVIAALYVTGAIACCLWLVLGHLLLLGMTQTARRAEGWLAELYADLPYERVKPRLLVSPRCRRAFSTGVIRPQIVLPADLCQSHRKEQLRDVLLHELAHVARRDAMDRWLFNVAFPLLYFHPLYWWLRHTAEMSAELIADDVAARSSSPEMYAEQLIALAREHGRSLVPGMGTLQILGSHTRFYRRMNMLIRRREQLDTRCPRSWGQGSLVLFVIALAGSAGMFGIGPLNAQEDSARTPDVAIDPNDDISAPGAKPAPTPRVAPTPPSKPGEETLNREETNIPPGLRDALSARRRQLDAQRAAAEAQLKAAKAAAEGAKRAEFEAEQQRAVQLELFLRFKTELDVLQEQLRHLNEGHVRLLGKKKLDEAANTLSELNRLLKRFDEDRDAVAPDWVARQADPAPTFRTRPVRPRVAGTPSEPPRDRVQATPARAPTNTADYHAGYATEQASIPLDLIQLADAYSDALEQREITKIEVELLASGKGAVAEREVRLANTRLKSAERKLHVVRKIVESALRAADIDLDASKQELQRARKLAERGILSQSQLSTHQHRVAQAELRLEIVRTILDQ